jgi:hypothetical protein
LSPYFERVHFLEFAGARPNSDASFISRFVKRMGGICSRYPQCCGGLTWLLDEYINQTFAATNWYCYPDGHPPNWTNTSNITTDGVVLNAIPWENDGLGGQLDPIKAWEDYEKYLAEKKRLYVDIPIMLSQISGAISIFTCTVVIGIFIAILIYQPIMYDLNYLYDQC